MAIIPIPIENLERFTLTANPRRTFTSSSSGLTGSVKVFSRASTIEKEAQPLEDYGGDSWGTADVEELRVQTVRDSRGSSDISGNISQYLETVNSSSASPARQKKVEVIRFEPSFKLTSDSLRKNVVRKVLFPTYRSTYPTLQWAYPNYHTLHFFTSDTTPTGSVLIYPAATSSGETNEVDNFMYSPHKEFTFDFYINPKYSSEPNDSKFTSTATFTFSDKPPEESTITLLDSDGTSVAFEIDNENNGLKPPGATFTLTDKPNEGSTINLIDDDGTSVTFEVDNENDGVSAGNVALNGIAAAGGGAAGTAADLAAKINAQTALDITASASGIGVITITQGSTVGRSGNTTITVNDAAHWNSVCSVNVPSAFTGGRGDVAVSGIAAAGGGATGTATDLTAKINAQSSLDIVATNPSAGVVLLTQGAVETSAGNTAITLDNAAAWNASTSVNVPSTFTGGTEPGRTVYHPGTVIHMSSSYAVSLISGSSKDHNGKTDGFRIMLQLSNSAETSPRNTVVTANSANQPFPQRAVGTGEQISDMVFFSKDNALKRNHWHHVAIRWGSSINNGTGSFVIDGKEDATFVVTASSVMPQAFEPPYGDPDAVFVGNFYDGPNNGTLDGSGVVAQFFNANAAHREGVTSMFTNDSYDMSNVDATHNDIAEHKIRFSHPLRAEIHDLKIFNTYHSLQQIASSSQKGPDPLPADLIFYVPPFFVKETKEREVMQTPFQTVRSTTDDPFNVALSFGVGGHMLNLPNFTREFVNGLYPRLFNLTGSTIDVTTNTAELCNLWLYRNASLRKRNLTVLPCDNGRFSPSFNLLKSGTRVEVPASGSLIDRFVNDSGNIDYGLINLSNMVSTASLPEGLIDITSENRGRQGVGTQAASAEIVYTATKTADQTTISLTGLRKNSVTNSYDRVTKVYRFVFTGGVNGDVQGGKVIVDASSADADTVYDNFVSAVNGSTGHAGLILASRDANDTDDYAGVVTLNQRAVGTIGNTNIGHNLTNLYRTLTSFTGGKDNSDSSISNSLEGAPPEDPGVAKSGILTILNRTKDPSSNQVAFFDVSNLFYGNQIRRGSFQVTDTSVTGSGGVLSVTLRDDGHGGLYRADALSKHATWNAVGNIIYEEGIAVVKTPNIPIFGADEWTTSFEGEHNVHVLEINVPCPKGTVNSSSNPTFKALKPTDYANETASQFSYITSVNLHDESFNVIGRANLAQPIVKRDSDGYLFRLRIDY